MSLKDKRIVIVGGSSGMGLASAKMLALAGASVIIAGRSEERLVKAKEEIGERVETYPLDATKEENVKAFFEKIDSLDHLVTTAASGMAGPFLEMETGAFRAAFESKFWGQYYSAKYAASRITKDGSITFFSGVASRKPIPGLASFAAVNGAIESLCRSLALELAPIRVNVVSPGITDTPVYDNIPEDQRRAYFQSLSSELPVKRVGKPEDIAKTVVYLIENGFTTGSVIDVDGGHRLV